MSVVTAEPSQMERVAIDPHVAFAELSKIMLGAEPLNLTLERIAQLACATMSEVDEVSMTLLEGGKAGRRERRSSPVHWQSSSTNVSTITGSDPASTRRSAARRSWWT